MFGTLVCYYQRLSESLGNHHALGPLSAQGLCQVPFAILPKGPVPKQNLLQPQDIFMGNLRTYTWTLSVRGNYPGGLKQEPRTYFIGMWASRSLPEAVAESASKDAPPKDADNRRCKWRGCGTLMWPKPKGHQRIPTPQNCRPRAQNSDQNSAA